MWANVGSLHRESMFISFDEEVPLAIEKRHVTPDGLAPFCFLKCICIIVTNWNT